MPNPKSRLFVYPGSKMRLARYYPLLLPSTCLKYVILFCGCAVELAWIPRTLGRVVNDLNVSIVTFFRVLREDDLRLQLCRRLRYTPDGRVVLDECWRILNLPKDELAKLDPVAHAWAFVVAHLLSFRGIENGGWCPHNHTTTRNLRNFETRLGEWVDLLQDVKLECDDYRGVVERFDSENTHFSADAPYMPDTFDGVLYKHPFTIKDHEDFLRVMRGIKGTAMICGYPHLLYDYFLLDWRCLEFPGCSLNARQKRTDCLWLNCRPDGTRGMDTMFITQRFVKALGGIENAYHWLNQWDAMAQQPFDEESWLRAAEGGETERYRLLIAKRYLDLIGSMDAADRHLRIWCRLTNLPK